MTEDRQNRVKEIFVRISETDEADQARVLDEECGDDAELRAQVESLLRHANLAPDDFLDPPESAGEWAESARRAALPGLDPGTEIGEYRIRRLLGEGGMGMVYEAEHVDSERGVAIKVIKPGMDSRTVIERFEFERQTLSLLSHQNIATVIDAGSADNGLPFFVMELVHGQPIAEFADAHSLDVRQRVELVAQVVLATEHAHCFGVIHRDLKDTNILVVEGNDGPTAKVIDFGIARLLSARGATSWTTEGRLIGTPEYMSPEQIEGSGATDVRSDIYSLGVLLYRLLAGVLPVAPEELAGAGPAEMRDRLMLAKIPPPSSRVDAPRTARQVRGELDWVTMRAMHMDPEARYATALELLYDLRSWLAGDAVSAGPQTWSYRLRATVRRHRILTSAAALVLIGFAVACVALFQTNTARQAETDARVLAESVNDFVQREMLAAAAPTALGLDAPLQMVLHDAIRRFDRIFASRPRVEIGVRRMLGETLINCQRPDLALMQWERAEQLAVEFHGATHETTLRTHAGRARAWTALDELVAAEQLLRSTLRSAEENLGREHELVLLVRSQLGHTLALAGDPLGFEVLDAAIDAQARDPETPSTHLRQSRRWRAEALSRHRRHAAAITSWREHIEDLTREVGREHPSTLAATHDLGLVFVAAGRHEESIAPLRRVLAARRIALGERHANTHAVHELLIESLAAAGHDAEASQERARLEASKR